MWLCYVVITNTIFEILVNAARFSVIMNWYRKLTANRPNYVLFDKSSPGMLGLANSPLGSCVSGGEVWLAKKRLGVELAFPGDCGASKKVEASLTST